MNIFEQAHGIHRCEWLSEYDFVAPLVVNHIKVTSNSIRPLHEVLEQCFNAEDFNAFEVLDITPDEALLDWDDYRSNITEWNQTNEHDATLNIVIFTKERPVIDWAKRIPIVNPEADIQLDYQQDGGDLFGRVIIRKGVLMETHMIPVQ